MTILDETTVARAARTHGVLARSELRTIGWSRSQIDERVRNGRWRALLHGVLLVDGGVQPSEWPDLPFDVRLQAAQTYHGPRATFVHETAARLFGLEGMPPDDGTVQVSLPPGGERHQQREVEVHPLKLRPDERTRLEGWSVTAPGRTVTDLVLRLPRLAAVSVLDSALRLDLVSPAELPDLRLRTFRRRGAFISAGWWDLADGRADSPLETRVRLLATDFGYPPDDLQHPVYGSRGELLGYGDLAWRMPSGRTLIAEADGRGPHELPSALFRDRRRANGFSAVGTIEVVRFTWADTLQPEYIRAVLRSHLGPPRCAPTG